MSRAVNDRLAARFHQLQIERVLRAETVADRAARPVDAAAKTIAQILLGRSRQKLAEIANELRGLIPQIQQSLSETLPQLARWSHRQTVKVFAREIPRKWLRSDAPQVLFVGEAAAAAAHGGGGTYPPGQVDLPKGGVADSSTEPIVGRRLPPDEWERWLAANLFRSPTAEEVDNIVRQPVKGVTWQERIQSLSRLVDPEAVASRLTTTIPEGLNVDELTREILPLVDGGIKASARRIARTESLRVANEMQRRSYEDIDDLTVGIQIVATLDENTRPHHVLRNGTIYYKDGRDPSLEELPVLPDEPNCRCFDIPVMSAPEGFGEGDPALTADIKNASGYAIPDPAAYADWFDKADHGRRMIAVGARRYQEMARRLDGIRSPEWADFVDETGKLQPLKKLRAETEPERESRRQKVIDLMRSRNKLLAKVKASGFADGFGPDPDRGEFFRGVSDSVVDAVTVKANPERTRLSERVLNVIDAVHGSGTLPRIPLRWDEPDVLGSFEHSGFEGFSPVTDRTATKIAINPNTPYPQLTIVHEVGHLIDQQAIGIRDFASESDRFAELFRNFNDAVDNSAAIRSLRALDSGPDVIFRKRRKIGLTIDKGHTEYLLRRREIFARAYAQWVAVRSRDKALLEELAQERRMLRKKKDGDVTYKDSWAEKDFRPIAKALDGIFSELGWLR